MQFVCAQWFVGRDGSEVNVGHVFPQGVLAVITLLGGGAGDGGARSRARCEQSFSCAQWLSPPYQGWGHVPRY